MSFVLITALLSPLVFLVPKRYKVWFTLGLVAAGAGMAATTAVRCLAGGAVRSGECFRWEYTVLWGKEYAAMDMLSAVFVLLICVGAAAVTLYSRGYLEKYLEERPGVHFSLHYMSLSLLFFSMLGVVTCRGGYGFLICWELMTVCSFLLILFDAGRSEVRRAALSYLIMMHVGMVFLLCGFITLQTKGLPVNFDSLGAYFNIYPPIPLFILFLAGFGMKAGLFPLHTWLPEAHPAAPAHVSAFMSGVMIKMGVYGVLRVASYMQSELMTAGLILLVAGMVTGVWGVLFAAVQNDIKRLLAYSSIENTGIIFMAAGLALAGRAMHLPMLTLCAMSGALLHTFNHSMFKTLLFFGAGNIYTATHTTSMESLGGLARRMPVTAALFLLGAGAICALPPLCGFVSEFLIFYGLLGVLGAGADGLVMAIGAVLALSFTGGVAVLAFTKLYGVVFSGHGRSRAADGAKEVDRFRIAGCAIPAAGIIVVGLAPFLIMGTVFEAAGSVAGIDNAGMLFGLFVDRDIFMLAAAGLVFVSLTVIFYAAGKLARSRRGIALSPTWGCGFGEPSPAMQYTGESFAEGLQNIAPHLSGTLSAGSRPGENEIFPTAHSFRVTRDDRVASLFNAWWVELLRRINSRVMKMRTGKVNHYVLYAMLFLLIILLLSIVGLI